MLSIEVDQPPSHLTTMTARQSQFNDRIVFTFTVADLPPRLGFIITPSGPQTRAPKLFDRTTLRPSRRHVEEQVL